MCVCVHRVNGKYKSRKQVWRKEPEAHSVVSFRAFDAPRVIRTLQFRSIRRHKREIVEIKPLPALEYTGTTSLRFEEREGTGRVRARASELSSITMRPAAARVLPPRLSFPFSFSTVVLRMWVRQVIWGKWIESGLRKPVVGGISIDALTKMTSFSALPSLARIYSRLSSSPVGRPGVRMRMIMIMRIAMTR